jgi:hypothetical protein
MADMPCALCGEPIPENAEDPLDSRSDEHVPPLQFYPKSMRPALRKDLWTVPSHRKCNRSYQKDEDYFYHRTYPLVSVQNEAMGTVLLDDIRRRAKKPQTRVMLRHMLKECRHVSPGGILLPPGLVRVEYDVVRIQRVVTKIAQCLIHKDYKRFMPRKNCTHIEVCENPTDLQDFFADLWRTERLAVEPSVFSYAHVHFDGFYCYAMLFWNAFMYCLVFEDPAAPSGEGS